MGTPSRREMAVTALERENVGTVPTVGSFRHVLLISSDAVISRTMIAALRDNGYIGRHALTGQEAIGLIQEQSPSLIILDLALSDMDGLVLLSDIKSFTSAPVLVFGGTQRKQDIVLSFRLGAADFLAKPIQLFEFEARVDAIHNRRARGDADITVQEAARFSVNDLTIDSVAQRALLGNVSLHLTPTEFRLIASLASQPSQIASREELRRMLRGNDNMRSSRSIDVHMSRIRQKLRDVRPDAPNIVSVRMQAYHLVHPTQASHDAETGTS